MLQAWRVEKVDMEQRAKELEAKKQEGKVEEKKKKRGLLKNSEDSYWWELIKGWKGWKPD